MKRFIALLAALLLAVSMFAQSKAPISFLGIPIDGTKDNMIKALVNKGLKHSGEDVLIGEFNGRKSHIYVGTNRNKVYRIVVAYADDVSESQIKINYNNLLSQFKKSEKYVESEENLPIPESEDISYEMTVHEKVYESAFWVKPSFTEEEELQIQKGVVWFRIFQDGYGKYFIGIFYDNLLNMANGEEL